MMDGAIRPASTPCSAPAVPAGWPAFDKFIALLSRHHWRAPGTFSSVVNVQVGQELLAINSGGETHTFTEVEAFGGIVPELNAVTGNTIVAPECLALSLMTSCRPVSYSDDVEEAGDELYQCCIHPWMRAIVHAR